MIVKTLQKLFGSPWNNLHKTYIHIAFYSCQVLKFKTLVCRFWYLHILSGARKSSILAGSKEFCSEKMQWKIKGKIVGPNTSLRVSRFSGTQQKSVISCWVMVLIIHCSPVLTKVELCRMVWKDKTKRNILNGGKKNEM